MLISAEHVSKKYALKRILQDVSFSIEERDKIALVGINGTGKSTLLKILSGKEQCDDGTLLKNVICAYPCWNRIQFWTMRLRSCKKCCSMEKMLRNMKQRVS